MCPAHPPRSPRGNDPLAALERLRRVFSPRLFLMQVWMSPRSSQLSAGDCGEDRNQEPSPSPRGGANQGELLHHQRPEHGRLPWPVTLTSQVDPSWTPETELDKDGWAVTGSQQAPWVRCTILGCSSYS